METNTSQFALPADLISGEVTSAEAIRPLSVFDMFRVGIGPSSSHTVGPMRAGLAFVRELTDFLAEGEHPTPTHLTVDLFGSLGATGRGHSTDRAVLLGLGGYKPKTVPAEVVNTWLEDVRESGTLKLMGDLAVEFNYERDMRFLPSMVLPYHVNGLTITARTAPTANPYAVDDTEGVLLRRTYYSVGGGFVMAQTNDDPENPEVEAIGTSDAVAHANTPAPYPFATARELLAHCREANLNIAQIVRANEEAGRPRQEVDDYMDFIHQTMSECVEAGCSADGTLPGGLNVRRRAAYMADRLSRRMGKDAQGPRWAATTRDSMRAMDWVNLYALAVNEENAAGHRVVTAPTNGAAGVIPAVLCYLEYFCPEGRSLCDQPDCPECQSVPMSLRSEGDTSVVEAAGQALAESQDANEAATASIRTPEAENAETSGPPAPSAGEIAPEDTNAYPQWLRVKRADSVGHVNREVVHDFLLAATAVGALIKTNASIAGAEVGCQGEVGSASAMAAAGLAQALGGTPLQVENAAEIAMEHSLGLTCDPVGGLVQVPCIERNAIAAVKAINAARMALWGDGRHTVSLDAAIETMRQTGVDMMSKYKETSTGGLAVNVVEC
ncbi:L-serine ammonia-lyase [Boudabousia tangfeifanii]|uniref:L-serine dehydratase n=1 Tax=Boudabousia tangfeifanii TaxID=1912795 RepID=A0A1D9MHW7_9ACTO|nr:L-serine ammonia-lyase, iron-sulfur-dependent, subunit alpha [Boudabousia tangfeifanii]AOZ71892.1 L-serine ammonia-lyase [Boudabousia tangfeifanii]